MSGCIQMNYLKSLQFRWFDSLMAAASRGDKDLSEVRWLLWRISKNDASILTANLRLPKLAVLDLSFSDVSEDWEGWSSLRASTRLRALDLSHCKNLRSTPDLSAFTQLTFLNLSVCTQLEHLHPSIGELKSLVSLDLSHCHRLEELPEEVGELKDLEELHIYWSGITQIPTSIRFLGKLKKLQANWCTSLRGIPSSIGDLRNLELLGLRGTGIEELPSAIGRLKNLQTLDLQGTSISELPSAIGRLKNLQTLDLQGTSISELPSAIGRLKSLQALDLQGTPISDLPESIQNLSSLQRLDLSYCSQLQSLPELPSSLAHLSISRQRLRLPQLSSLIHLEELHLWRCHLLEDIADIASRLWKLDGFRYLESFSVTDCSSIGILDLSELVHLKRLRVESCNNLVEIQGHDKLEFLEVMSIVDCNSIKKLLCPKSRCLKELEVRLNGNLVEVQGPLDGAKFLKRLSIGVCESLETFPDLTGCEKLQDLFIQGCKKITQFQGIEKFDLIHPDIFGWNHWRRSRNQLEDGILRDYERDIY